MLHCIVVIVASAGILSVRHTPALFSLLFRFMSFSKAESLFCLSENLEQCLSKNKLSISVEQMNENHILLLLIRHMWISCLPSSTWAAFGLIQWINGEKNHHQNVWMIRSGRMSLSKMVSELCYHITKGHLSLRYRLQETTHLGGNTGSVLDMLDLRVSGKSKYLHPAGSWTLRLGAQERSAG